MEWKTIRAHGKAKPTGRWGHSCCVVDQALYLFGGFKDLYMNDLWRYQYLNRTWTQLNPQGDIPQPRSNASLFYDQVQNQLVLYGGGASNKQRHGGIFLLDLSSMLWRRVESQVDEQQPWPRTYHCAEFKHPYLVVFGGEFCTDLGDLWVYNVVEHKWRELKLQEGPSGRKFASSCFLNSKMFMFGGCSGDYQCQDQSMYQLDLNPLWQRGSQWKLEWKKHEIQGCSIEGRWGHYMTSYKGQIVIYGGRVQRDQKDFFLIDPRTMVAEKVETTHKQDRRRKVAGGMLGCCLVLFGGFNGRYSDDFFYIDLSLLKAISSWKNGGDFRTAKMHSMVWKECLQEVESDYYGTKWLCLNGATRFKVDLGLVERLSPLVRLMNQWSQEKYGDLQLRIQEAHVLAFRVVIAFTHTQRLILPSSPSVELLYSVASISQYLCIGALTSLCEKEFINLITLQDRSRLQTISEELDFEQLKEACAWSQIDEVINNNLGLLSTQQEQELSDSTLGHYNYRKFEYAHRFSDSPSSTTPLPPQDNSKLFASFNWSMFGSGHLGVV